MQNFWVSREDVMMTYSSHLRNIMKEIEAVLEEYTSDVLDLFMVFLNS